jgi:site-specific recombinase XerD
MVDNAPINQSEIARKINDFLEYLQVERGSSLLTIRNYKHYLSRFVLWMESEHIREDLIDINPDVIRRFRVYLTTLPGENLGQGRSLSTLSRRTQSYHAIALRSFLKWLVKNDFTVMAPDKIDLPKVEERQVKFLSGEQVDRLLNAPSQDSIAGKRDKAILEVLFSTGLRVSELTKLDRDKVNLETREFGVVGKGGKARVVFLSSRATDWLVKYLNERNDHYKPLFIHHKGKVEPTTQDEKMRLTPRSVQRMIKKYSHKMKMPFEVTPHSVRHSFATDLLNAGADIRSVQEMLGHKNISTTQIYTHVTNKQLRDVHEAFHGHGGK